MCSGSFVYFFVMFPPLYHLHLGMKSLGTFGFSHEPDEVLSEVTEDFLLEAKGWKIGGDGGTG